MSESMHALAPHQLPFFIPAADGSDQLFWTMLALLILGVVLLGTFYLHLHSLPERLAHDRVQFELVAVLCLLALFTHNTLFWVAALLLAFVKLPDFWTPLESIASSLGTVARVAKAQQEADADLREAELDISVEEAPTAELEEAVNETLARGKEH